MRGGAFVILAALAGPGHAAPIDPHKLATLVPAVAGKSDGEPTAVYAANVDADVVMLAFGTGDFAMLSGSATIDGKLGDGETVGARRAFDAIAPAGTVRIPRITGSRRAVDVELRDVSPLDVLRFLADVAGASYVFAPQHALPHVTIRAKHADPRETARTIAKLAGLELVERGHVWIVVEPGVKLDLKLAAKTEPRVRLEIDHAHPGEAQRLLDPAVDQDHNGCPKNVTIDASLHGEIGALRAVLATLGGPPCEQEPKLDELDTATAQLVGILVGAKARRAVFRVPHGARAFEPTTGEDHVEVDYVVVHGGESTGLHAHAPIVGQAYVAPGPFEADDEATWQLRGTVRVGTTWRAIFRSKSEWRIVGAPAEITAGTARSTTAGKPRGYTLER